ncbi:MAG: hypothetical protein NZO58_05580 [Gemmataceae bacterium]|nr:hypothetical protein [Gemmataceae bacterium]
MPRTKAAALQVDFDYFEVLGVGMFRDRANPHPRQAVPLLWAGEKVRPEHPLPAPPPEASEELEPGTFVVALPALVRMKLMCFCDQNCVHLQDMIEVGLIARDQHEALPPELAARLAALLTAAGR